MQIRQMIKVQFQDSSMVCRKTNGFRSFKGCLPLILFLISFYTSIRKYFISSCMLLLSTVFVYKVIYRFNHELMKNLYCKQNF